jgi:hypothetical protein
MKKSRKRYKPKNTLTKRKSYDILPEDLSGDDYTVWVW